MKVFAPHLTDFYKVGHIKQYPPHTTVVYSNFTPRSRHLASVVKLDPSDDKVLNFGLSGIMQWLLVDVWNDTFFKVPKAEAIAKYKRRMDNGIGPDAVDVKHFEDLHDLGYLPIIIQALPEGELVPVKVPLFTVINTHSDFYWLPNYLETQLSSEMWKSVTTATTSYEFRKLLVKYAQATGAPVEGVDFQGHDFSMRGQSGVFDATQCGAAHLACFAGTDTISALDYLEDYYAGKDDPFLGGSVPATEHSVMCMGGQDTELETYDRIISTYPTGIVSIVSDTWDYWNVLTDILPKLKDKILARQPNALGLAKVVIRPDSGDPIDIICGNSLCKDGTPENKGSLELLWEIFGGTVNDTGYRVLNPRIGLIYGDSITLPRAHAILERMKEMGFCSSNVVFGIGSFTYQYVTRDTYGFAIKATAGVVNDKLVEISKDPVTDSGTKKSAKGLLRVVKDAGEYKLLQQCDIDDMDNSELKTVFENGEVTNKPTITAIRAKVRSHNV